MILKVIHNCTFSYATNKIIRKTKLFKKVYTVLKDMLKWCFSINFIFLFYIFIFLYFIKNIYFIKIFSIFIRICFTFSETEYCCIQLVTVLWSYFSWINDCISNLCTVLFLIYVFIYIDDQCLLLLKDHLSVSTGNQSMPPACKALPIVLLLF